MYQFITWVIEYSEDEWTARVLFVLSVPLLLIAKIVLLFGEGVGSLFSRRNRAALAVASPGNGGPVTY